MTIKFWCLTFHFFFKKKNGTIFGPQTPFNGRIFTKPDHMLETCGHAIDRLVTSLALLPLSPWPNRCHHILAWPPYHPAHGHAAPKTSHAAVTTFTSPSPNLKSPYMSPPRDLVAPSLTPHRPVVRSIASAMQHIPAAAWPVPPMSFLTPHRAPLAAPQVAHCGCAPLCGQISPQRNTTQPPCGPTCLLAA